MRKPFSIQGSIKLAVLLLCCLYIVPISFTMSFASNSEQSHEQESSHQEHDDSEKDDDDSDDDDHGRCGNKNDDGDDDGDSKDDDDNKSNHHSKSSSSHNDDGQEKNDDGNDDGDNKDDDDHGNDDCGNQSNKPLGTAHVVIDNTAGFTNYALLTNLATSSTPACSKSDVLNLSRCNSFSLGSNDIQVIQNDANGNLTKMIGIDNTNSSSYENKGKDTQLNYFSPGKHLIDINSIRHAANQINNLSPGLPEGTYGNISFKQFIQNVALGRSMYGVVRVEVPLVNTTPRPPKNEGDHNDDGNDDGDDNNDDGHKKHADDNHDSDDNKTKIRYKSSTKNKHNSDHDGNNDDSENDDGDDDHKPSYRLCGEKPTPQCLLCGPGGNTKIRAGKTVCGIKLGNNAQVNVFGSLMFEWIDCDNKLPISLSDLDSNAKGIQFNLAVPVNINPVNTNADHSNMKTIKNITQIIGSNTCPSGSPCNLPLNKNIPFSLISPDAKQDFQYKSGNILTAEIFNTLTQASKFHLTMPSGYASGWATAFSKLNIDATTWRNWGFNTPDVSGILTTNDIRNDMFQDMPAFLYSGGIVGLHHSTNISGLLYIPQAFDLEQNGLLLSNNQFIPSLQYINGSIIVRDGFYLKAKYKGGATLISNNPDTYSRIKLDASNERAGKFERFIETAQNDDGSTNPNDNNTGGNGGSGGNNGSGGSGGNGNSGGNGGNNFPNNNPGAQWMEIRPQ